MKLVHEMFRFAQPLFMQGIADSLFDENAVAQTARPGTSFSRPMTSAAGKVQTFKPINCTLELVQH